ncbi:MAG: hypothetical protein ACRD98_00375 [Nitrososphaera sp.]
MSDNNTAAAPEEDIPEALSGVPEEDEVGALKKKVEELSKRTADTYSAYQQGQEKISRLEKAMAERDKSPRPALLEENEELEQSIKYVIDSVKNKPTESERWIAAVGSAIPDINTLMEDEDFKRRAHEERERIGDKWQDPLMAIRTLSMLRADFLKDQALAGYEKTYQKTQAKAGAMEVPGGSSKSASREKPIDEAEAIRNMSAEDFARMRAKVLGYQ